MDKSPLAMRTVWMGAIAAIAGYLQVAYAVTITPDVQARIIETVLGLVTIFAGKGAILFRVLAAFPKVRELESTLKTIWNQIQDAKHAPVGGSAPIAPAS